MGAHLHSFHRVRLRRRQVHPGDSLPGKSLPASDCRAALHKHRHDVQSDTAQSRCQMFSGLGVGYPLRACPGFGEGGMERKDERE